AQQRIAKGGQDVLELLARRSHRGRIVQSAWPSRGERADITFFRGHREMILAAALTFTGFLTARGINVESQRSWIDGGFGRFETGAKNADDSASKARAEGQLGIDWTPTSWLRVHAHGVARSKRSGLVEAYVDLQKDFGANNLRLRAGQFFLPTSRENTDPLWSSPYTISFSALNTW